MLELWFRPWALFFVPAVIVSIYSFFSSYRICLCLGLISILLTPCVSVRKNTRA